MLQIKPLSTASLADVLGLYNQGVARNRYSGRLDEATWEAVIASKYYYSPDDVLLAYESEWPLGYVHLCHAPNAERSAPDPAVGSIEALFFAPTRLDVGAALLDAAVSRHRASGATRVLGWSSFSGYPLYRGVFVGLEPMALEADGHVVEAFLAAGFQRCQHSVEMGIDFDQPVREPQPQVAVEFSVARWHPAAVWEAATWQGLAPYRNQATIDGAVVASCLYAMMPVISATYGVPVGCIGGLHTVAAWQRKGIAAFLVARALNHMHALGARRVTLGTQHDNRAAHATYRRLGMAIEDDACAFELVLPDSVQGKQPA
jgi:GNAT superfamily N-acetyltransferase